MTRRALGAPVGLRRRLAALLVAALAAAVLVPVSAPASASGVQIPAEPSGLDTETTAGSLDVSVDWDDVAGATEYLVRWRRSGPGQALNVGLTPTASNATITVADVGSWVVRVQACNTAGCSRPAAESFETEPAPEPVPTTTTTAPVPVTTTTAPAVESLAVAVSPSATEVPAGEQVTLSADITGAPAGTPAYQWEMSYGGSWWFTLDSTATASYLASSPETVQFRVTVWYPSGESATSPTASVAFVTATPVTTTTQPAAPTQPPGRPTGLDADTTAGSLDVSVDWDDTTGADRYVVQWRRRGAGHALNAGITPTASNATITVADWGRWVVRVQACNSVGCSPAKAAGFETEAPAAPAAPTEFEVDADEGLAVEATWDDTQGATRYELEWRPVPDTSTLGRSLGRSLPNNGGLPGDSLQTATASATATVAGAGLWQFLLSACNDGGCSTPTVRTVTVRNTIDYDRDNDGLIEIRGDNDDTNGDNNADMAKKLNAIRYDLDGDGTVAAGDQASYDAAFPNAVAGMGCPSSGCKGYELVADLTLSGNWVPLELSGYTSRAGSRVILDGNGHTISGLTIDAGSQHVGLIDRLNNHEVRDLGIIAPDVNSRHAGTQTIYTNVGALAGLCHGCVIDGVYVSGGSIRSTGSNDGGFPVFNVGGLVGNATGCSDEDGLGTTCTGANRIVSRIVNSYATASVAKEEGKGADIRAGGLVGESLDTFIASSYATGAVTVKANFTSDAYLGGLVGYSSRFSEALGPKSGIAASYATGTVTYDGEASGNNYVGGLVGRSRNVSTTAYGSAAITASYAIGKVSSTDTTQSSLGGLVGHFLKYGINNTLLEFVSVSFYNSDKAGQSDTGKGVPKTTSELITPTQYAGTIFSAWNVDLDNADGDNDRLPAPVRIRGGSAPPSNIRAWCSTVSCTGPVCRIWLVLWVLDLTRTTPTLRVAPALVTGLRTTRTSTRCPTGRRGIRAGRITWGPFG